MWLLRIGTPLGTQRWRLFEEALISFNEPKSGALFEGGDNFKSRR